jgi:SAM-dependent methyltransferase
MNPESLIDKATKRATSITHKHILSIINTKLKNHRSDHPVRILDAGCGNGELIAYLESFIPQFVQGMSVEVYGFDVSDSKIQFDDFFEKAGLKLNEGFGHIDWKSRLKIIGSQEPWPFKDEYFDIVVSNQVLEHVHNHDYFFSQNWRVLKNNGFAVHLFPVKNYIFEGHVRLPYAHRFKQWRLLHRYIKLLSSLRMGKWKHISQKCKLEDYARSYADFLTFYCHYVSIGDLIRAGNANGFRTGFSFTGNFYYEKLKEILNIPHRFFYKKERSHPISVHLFKYIQGITLFIEKADDYRNYIVEYAADAKGIAS